MPAKPISQKGWIKGVVAVMDRFSIPKGAIMKASNMLLTNRGALTTCDGTALQSSLNAAPFTRGIVEIGTFIDPGTFVATKLALIPVDATHLRVYSWLGTGDTLSALTGPGTDLTLTAGWTQPQIINFAGFSMITVGNGVTPYVYNGATFVQVSSDTSGAGGGAGWQAKNFYSIGDRISAVNGNTENTTFQVVQVTVGSSSGTFSNSSPVGGGGYSGTSTPAFSGATTAGDIVNDNQLLWMQIRQTASLAKQTTPAGGAHGISHAAAIWLWNTSPSNSDGSSGVADGPSVLRQSGPNNPNTWPDANIVFVGKDDGTQGTGIATFTIAEAGISPTGSLVLFKEYSTYQVTGVFGANNFAITQVKTDMGCLASRSVLFATGFGILRFCHLGFALFDGVNDRLISEEIRPYIFGRSDIQGVDFATLQNARAALTTNPPMYVCMLPTLNGTRTRMFCYDLVMRAWMIVDYVNGSNAFPVTAMKQLRLPQQSAQAQGPHTYIADLNSTNVVIRQWQQGDVQWDATNPATSVAWSFQPPEVGDPGSRAYFRRAMVRLHAASSGFIKGAFNVGSAAQPFNQVADAGAGPSSGNPPNLVSQASYEGEQDLGVSLDIAQTGPSANGTFSGAGPVTVEGVDWHVVGKQPRPFGQAS